MAKSKLKKLGFCMAAAMLMTLTLGVAAACTQEPEPTPQTQTYTVTFYDGSTVITTREVEEGETVEAFEPSDVDYEKEGYTFGGWYATADFTFDWSFDTAITRDTNVYSMWSSAAEDARQWLIAGSSSAGGPLAAIGWNGVTGLRTPLFEGLPEGSEFYFVHSYYAPVGAYTIGRAEYGAEYSAAVWDGRNAYGVQFHPEKSGETGLKILTAFAEL